jgi:L-seryl-tRNA(Ser) seleniumtransferase
MTTTPAQQNKLRQLPAVHVLLDDADALCEQYGRDTVADALRDQLDQTRQAILNGAGGATDAATLLQQTATALEQQFQPTLRPVINATGVIIHTNLGRALLSDAAQQAVQGVASQYSNLEFDLNSGKRGSRYTHAEALLCELTGAEAALVVNNNAAALVLLLGALAAGRGVILSRGQLVEIGGGFRIPDIMAQSGARLQEVGTTNRTRIADYAAAIDEETALLMRIHSSNFRLIGFIEEAPLEAMAHLAHEHNLYLVDDIGSGALLDTAVYGLAHEPTVHESMAAGADLVVFSGDKLLGGPQAGILVGRHAIIQQLKRHPLARAMRADKLCYAALSATLDHYRRNEATEKIPVWRMISTPLNALQARATTWQARIGGDVIPGNSTVGGGSLPGTTLKTALLALTPDSAEQFAADLRAAHTPVIARISEGRVLLDPRTVLPEQDEQLLTTLERVLS